MISELQDRHRAAERDDGAVARAQTVAARLPLVHRTGRAGRRWVAIFQNQRLDGAAPGTRFEREIGIERATYFFLGCGAYPHGSVALLLDGVPSEPRSTATPFDSGGCEANHCTQHGEELSAEQRAELLDRYMLEDGVHVADYAAHYIADMFDEPIDYVRRGQLGQPDRAPVHGLRDRSGDRRAWTVEVQVHGDVAVPPERLVRVLLREREQYRDMPRVYQQSRRVAVPAEGAGREFDNFDARITDAVVEHVEAEA